MLSRILAILNIRPGEERNVFLMLAQYFFMGAAMLFVQSASLALFFTTWDSTAMPYIYLGIALIVSSVTAIFLKISERTSLARFLTLSVLFVLIGSIVLRIGLAFGENKWLMLALPIWSQTLVNITVTAFWTLAGNIFNVRQGKRIFGLMNAGSWLAYVVMGPFTAPIVQALGTENLFIAISLSLLIAFIFQQMVIRANPGTQILPENNKDQNQKTSIWQLFRIRYIVLIFALIALWRIAYFILDNIFYDRVAMQYPSPTEMAGFIGGFFGVVGVLGFITDMFLTGRIISRFGLRAGLLATPALTALCMAALAVTGVVSPEMTLVLFWLAVTGKFSNEGLGFSLDQTADNLLYQPIHERMRVRVQTVTEGIIQPLAIGLAGGLLLLFNTILKFNAIQLTYIYLIFALGWLLICVALARAYPIALTEALHKRRFGDKGILLIDNASIRVLRNALNSPHAAEVLYSLDLLEKGESDTLSQDLAAAIRSPIAAVRREAIQRAERLRLSQLLPVILTQLKMETETSVRQTASCALIVLGADSNTAMHLLSQQDEATQYGALVGALRVLKNGKESEAANQLNMCIHSTESHERIRATDLIADARNDNLGVALLPLLGDDDLAVQKSALRAAAKIRNAEMYPAIIKALGSIQTRSLAFNALTKGGEQALPSITASLRDDSLLRPIRLKLIRACALIQNAEAVNALEELMQHPNGIVRLRALSALQDCRYKPQGKAKSMVSGQVLAEFNRAAWLLASLHDLEKSMQTGVIQRAIHLDIQATIQRLLLLFGFIYEADAIQRARAAIRRHDANRRAYAIEALDATLGREHKIPFIALLEELTPKERLEKMGLSFGQTFLPPAGRVTDILTNPMARQNPWLVATCIEFADDMGISLDRQIKDGLTASNESLLSRMVMQKQKENKMLTTVERVIILKSLSMFAETPDEALAELADQLQEQLVHPGDVIVREGETGDSLYIIVDGKVEVVDDNRVLNQLGARAVFGELSMLDSSPRTATIRALEETSLLRLDQTSFYEIMSDYVEVAMGTIQLLTRNLRARTGDVLELSRMLGQ